MSTHRDNISVIGTTHASSRSLRDKRWNAYYHQVYQGVVTSMLKGLPAGGTLLDVGTSHGHWLRFFKSKGFEKIVGVELDPRRAELARQAGYSEVKVGDASEQIPYPDSSVDLAISNDVFVHILRMEDKHAVVNEVVRVLKPGGVFIFNHTIAPAFGYSSYTVDGYCSYLTLAELVDLLQGTPLKIQDVKPTYFNFRQHRTFLTKFLKALLTLPVPFGLTVNHLVDYFLIRDLPLEAADVVYLKARKLG